MKNDLILVSAFLFLLFGNIQAAASPIQTDSIIKQDTDRIFDTLVNIRRDIHQHPELAGDEARTAGIIADRLRSMGLEVETGRYGHSVVAILRGAYPGKTIAWRADMDAIPGDFKDSSPFMSLKPNVHHACGHDIHIAIGLGIAEVLSKQRKNLYGNVVFIFQPEEETFKGAKALLQNGLLTTTRPDEIYGLHVTAFPVGQIVVRPNEMFAYQRRIRIVLNDQISSPEVQQLSKRIQGMLFRTQPDAKPWEIEHTINPEKGLASKSNAFQNYLIINEPFDRYAEKNELVLEANLYETHASNLGNMLARIEREISNAGYQKYLVSVTFAEQNPTVFNDAALTSAAIDILSRENRTAQLMPSYGQVPFFNDDFAYFQQQVPGVYFFLGGSNFEKGIIAMNHSPEFQVDEQSITVGVKSFSYLIFERLKNPMGK